MEQPLVFKSQDEQVVGILHLPEGDDSVRYPCAVFLHGFTGNKTEVRRMFVRAARALAAKGIAALRFDFRGSGDSEGDFSKTSFPDLIADAKNAFQFVKDHPRLDSSRLGVVGFSMGGLIASHVLAKEELKAGVLWSPVAHPSHLVNDAAGGVQIFGGGGGRVIDLGGWSVSKTFLKQYAKDEPLTLLTEAHVKTPILLIHGNEDDTVPLQHSYDYFDALKTSAKKSDLLVVEGAGHTYDSIEYDRQVISGTVKWLKRHLFS